MKFIFRSDASSTLGLGHVFRCLSLARILRSRGAQTCFVTLDLPADLADMIQQDGHQVKRISEYSRGNEKVDAEETLSGESDLAACILDHYQLGTKWERIVQAEVDVLAIDDLGRSHESRWVLDHNFYSDSNSYYLDKISPKTQAILGPRYALLRQEFERARQQAKVRNQGLHHVLVSFGGTDPDNLTSLALSAIDGSLPPEIKVSVIAGASHPFIPELNEWCIRRKGASLKVQVADMSEYFLAADLSIGAGGISALERCSCGLPAIAICTAANQVNVIREGSDAGFLWGFESIPSELELAEVLRAVVKAPRLLSHMSKMALTVTDGRGAKRVADMLMPLRIELREAVENDASAIFEWRTNPVTRAASRISDSFTFENHCDWLRQSLADPNRMLLIGTYQGIDSGVVRFDRNLDRAEVSIFLKPGAAGIGIGQAMLHAAESYLKNQWANIRSIDAWVNEDNMVSLRMFETLGYSSRVKRLEKELG